MVFSPLFAALGNKRQTRTIYCISSHTGSLHCKQTWPCGPFITGRGSRSKGAAKGSDRWANTVARVGIDLSARVRPRVAKQSAHCKSNGGDSHWSPTEVRYQSLLIHTCTHTHTVSLSLWSFPLTSIHFAGLLSSPGTELTDPDLTLGFLQIFNTTVTMKIGKQPKRSELQEEKSAPGWSGWCFGPDQIEDLSGERTAGFGWFQIRPAAAWRRAELV